MARTAEDYVNRINELAKLQDGWAGNGEGKKVTTAAVLNATQLSRLLVDIRCDDFDIFPTYEGELLFEKVGEANVMITVDENIQISVFPGEDSAALTMVAAAIKLLS